MKFWGKVGVLLCLGSCGIANAQTPFTIDAEKNSISTNPSGPSVGLPLPALIDTGFDIHAGDRITVTAVGNWTISGGDPITGPDGQPGNFSPTGTTWPLSSLLGQVSKSGPLQFGISNPNDIVANTFVLGANFSQISALSGRLYLAFNDTNYGDNGGSVVANVSVTSLAPEPSSLLFLLVGVCAWRKRRQ